MQKEVFEKFKNDYLNQKELLTEKIRLENRKRVMVNDDNSYFEQIGLNPNEKLNEEELINEVFIKYIPMINLDETNNIFVLLTKMLHDKSSDKYNYYFANLELDKFFIINDEKLDDFLKNNIVINVDSDNLVNSDDEFERIRTEFLIHAVDTSQDRAKDYIINKYINRGYTR